MKVFERDFGLLGVTFLLMAAWSCGPGESRESAETPLPNVLLILIDDLGWKDLGCYGSSFYETPHIDRFASQGMSFTNAYSACPVCSPSRGALMTGKSPARTGLTGHINPTGRHRYPTDGPIIPPDDFAFLPASESTIAEELRDLGYVTFMAGKWHMGGDPEHLPPNQGFQTAVGYMPGGSRNAPLHHYTYFYPYFDRSRSPGFEIPGMTGGNDGEYLTDRLTDETVSWLRNQSGEEPFFVYLSHYAVHTPLEAPETLVQKYREKLNRDGSQVNAVYGAMIENLDSNVGRILNTIDELGLSENTIVIFTSDNGGTTRATINAPLREGKGYLYEGGIRVPLMIRWPGRIVPGSSTDTPAISYDIFPTVLELISGRPATNPDLDGKSLASVLQGSESPEPRSLYWYYPHYSPQAQRPGGAIRVGSLKLIENYDPVELELFDLEKDLGEQHNLVAERPEVAEKLQEQFRQWLKQVNARLHRPNTAARR